MSVRAWDYMPGAPDMGHVTSRGFYHSGKAQTCHKCEDQPSITCPKCRRTSYSLRDISEGYCGACRELDDS